MRIEYDSNNSGGGWWLDDSHWQALEKAGWEVEWGGNYFCHSRWGFAEAPAGKPEPCKDAKSCPGHRRFDSFEEAQGAADNRFLGAVARGASKDFDSVADAIREFEKVTGMNASDEGCNCCGAPHTFQWKDEDGSHGYASGEECAAYLFPGAPPSYRAALERIYGDD